MIIVTIFGLDQFVVGRYSREASASISNLFEVREEEVVFSAPEHLIFHKGVEQTSWHVVVRISCPFKCHPFEEKVAKYIHETLSLYAINIELFFDYYEEEHHHYFPSDEYEEYLSEDNISEEVSDYEGDEDEDEEEDEDSHLEVGEGENQIYLGSVFAGHEDELDDISLGAVFGETDKKKK